MTEHTSDDGRVMLPPTHGMDAKVALWNAFVASHRISEECVPLFEVCDGRVQTMPYGRNERIILERSSQMDALMRKLGRQLIDEHDRSQVVHDGLIYMMLTREHDCVVPLYIGKAEIFGRGARNLSANIRDLKRGGGRCEGRAPDPPS